MTETPKPTKLHIFLASTGLGVGITITALAIYIVAQRIAPALTNFMPAAETMGNILYGLVAGALTAYIWNNTIGSNDDLRP